MSESVVKPLTELVPEDIDRVRKEIDQWLLDHTYQVIGIDVLIRFLSMLPISGSIMAAVDVVSDIIQLVDKGTEKADILDYSNLAIDVIGIIPVPATAAIRVTARPALALVRQEMLRGGKSGLSAAIVTVIANHINERVAGDIEKFCTSGLAEIGPILSTSGQTVQTITDTTHGGIVRVINEGQVFSNSGRNVDRAKQQFDGAVDGFAQGDAKRVVLNLSYMVQNLGKALIKSEVNATAQVATQLTSADAKQSVLTLANQFKRLGITANQKISGLSNPKTEQSIAWLLQVLLDSVVLHRKKAVSTSVAANKTAKAATNKNTQPLEKISKEVPANQNASRCKNGTSTGTGCSISFAKGTETLLHQDAQIHPLFAEQLIRYYSSDLYQYNDGIFGARWITPFNTAIIPATAFNPALPNELTPLNGFEYIGLDGRAIKLPELEQGESHYDAVEGFTYSCVSDDLKVITFDSLNHQIYKLDKTSQNYRLVTLDHEHGFTVGLRYDHLIDGQTYLSDLVFKQGESILAQVNLQLNTERKVAAAWLIQDNEPVRQLAAYRYDEFGNLIQATNEFAQSHHYAYQHHLLTRYTDLTGRGMNIEYDGILPTSKAVAEWADDRSSASQLIWDPDIRKTTLRDLEGNQTEHYYGITGYTYRTVYPDGLQEWFFRDDQKNIINHIALDDSETSYSYDERGNVLSMTQPDGKMLHYAYDEQNRLVGHVDAEDGRWLKEYDDQGNLIRETDPLKSVTQYRYNGLGLPVSIQDAKGGIKQLQYDAQGNLVRYVDCSGKAMQWEYDARNRVVCVTNALREKVTYHYSEPSNEPRQPIAANLPLNALGQLEKITYPNGSEEHYIHDAEGRLLVHIDANTQQTSYAYDQAGLITQRTDAMGQTLKYTWDRLSRLTCLTNENGARYQFKYDVMGRLLEEVDFDGKCKTYHYEQSTGQLTTSVEVAKRYGQTHDSLAVKDRIQHFVFDSMGRLEQRTAGYGHIGHELEHQQTEEFAYDGRGQLIKAKNQHSEIQWIYDAIGNLTREHQHDLTTKQTAVWQHMYDEIHDRVKTIRPDGQTLSHMTYGTGHVYGLAINGDDLVSFERDDLHRETLRHYANGLSQSQQYDVMGQLQQQTIQNHHQSGYNNSTSSPQNNAIQHSKDLIERVYQYDRTGQLTQIKDSRRGTLNYRYDPVGRLLEATSSLGRETFAFDPASNLLDPRAATSQTQTHSSKRSTHLINNVVQDYLDSKYEYDAYGQLIQHNTTGKQGQLNLRWDVFGRLIESRNAQYTASYRYDALGRRIAKEAKKQAGSSIRTIYGWDGEALAYESAEQHTRHYVYEKDSFIPLLQINYDQAITLHTTPQLAQNETYSIHKDPLWNTKQHAVTTSQIYYYHCDHLGTPQELSNAKAHIVWQAAYKAWGELKGPSVQQLFENSEIVTNNLRFQGQYFDVETGLHYNRHRYYSSEIGRFISKDPIGLSGGLNVYAYAPNPVGWVDPLGLNTRLGSGAKSAKDAADIALSSGKNKGAAAELKVNGKIYTGVSGSIGKTHPKVQQALDNVPSMQREKWHGYCGEISCANQALEEHESIIGSKSLAVNIGESGKGHGTLKKTCRSCQSVLNQLGVKYDY